MSSNYYNWRKSSYSGANGGSCVETASGDGVVLVRALGDSRTFTAAIPRTAGVGRIGGRGS
jgi:hypothetical protein